MRKLLCFYLFFIGSICLAQEKTIEIKGFICIQDENHVLKGAKVTVLDSIPQNQSMVLSDSSGFFSLTHQANVDSLCISISFPYCVSYSRTISCNQRIIDLDTIILREDEQLFEAIEVIAQRKPITFRNDTTIYDASSFITGKDDIIEDMLEILPGIMMSPGGEILADGSKVDRVLVDGKPFFGNDLTIAIRNLTQDIVYSVEVFNSKSESESFTGSIGNTERKTINIVLKPNKKNGIFGEVTAGFGIENKYAANGMINHFSEEQQISVLVNTNNINVSQFTGINTSDLLKDSRPDGIMNSRNVGFNYSDKLSDKLDLSSSYTLTHSESTTESSANRETILPQSSFFTNQRAVISNINENHSFNLGINYKPTSNLLINFRPSIKIGKIENNFFQEQEQFNEAFVMTNEQMQSSAIEKSDLQFNSRFSLTQLIGDNGGFFGFNFSHQNERTNKENVNVLTNEWASNPSENEERNQLIKNYDQLDRYSAEVNYKIAIRPKSVFLTFGMNYDYKTTLIQQDVTQVLGTAVNSELDLKRNTVDVNISPRIDFSLKKDKWTLTASSAYFLQNRGFIDRFQPSNNSTRTFDGLTINSNANYQLKNGLRFNCGYQLQNNPPLLEQVQTFPNLLNPLNIVLGNPSLKSTKTHHVKLGINSFSSEKNQVISISSSFRIASEQIAQTVEVDQNFVSTTGYININGGYNFSAFFNYRKRISIDTVTALHVNIAVNSSLNKSPSVNYGLIYKTTSLALLPTISTELSRKEWFKIRGDYRVSIVQTSFENSNFQSRMDVRHVWIVNTDITFFERLSWTNNVSFNFNASNDMGLEKLNWIWNSGLSYSFNGDKTTFSIIAYDILNSNASNNRIVTPTYIEYNQRSVLKRYLMFRISWKFRKM